METTPFEVARAKRKLKYEIRDELEQRYLDYRAELESLAPAAVAAAPAPPPPLTIAAEGDSWFEYPVPLSGGSVIDHLKGLIRLPIFNMAHHGDEARGMLGLEQRRVLEDKLASPDVPFEALLFSGGGNDLVGDQFCLWLKPYQAGAAPKDLIDMARLQGALSIVRAAYDDLIAIRDRVSKDTKIIINCYDFPHATGKPVCFQGPWLKPALEYRGIKERQTQFEVVKLMLQEFKKLLDDVATKHSNVHVVPTQGTVDPDKDWDNEIHPSNVGFKKIAQKFQVTLQQLFPGRVP